MNILAIDPGTRLGWATDLDGMICWGTEDLSLRRVCTEGLRWLKFTRWLEARLGAVNPRETIIVYEEQNNFNRGNSSSADIGKICCAFLLEFCERNHIPCEAVSNSRLKTFAIPALPRPKKGAPPNPQLDRSKPAMIAAAQSVLTKSGLRFQAVPWLEQLNEHEGDAVLLYFWARKRYA